MRAKQELISHYIKKVNEKEQLLEKLNLNALSQEELRRLLLLNCEISELVGKMVDASLIEVEILKD